MRNIMALAALIISIPASAIFASAFADDIIVVPDTITPSVLQGQAITPEGFGPLKIGMSLDEAAIALDTPLAIDIDGMTEDGACQVAEIATGVEVLLENGHIERISSFGNNGFKTPAGIMVGSSDKQFKKAYKDFRAEPHKYSDGHYYKVGGTKIDDDISSEPKYEGSGYMFETDDNGKIFAYHAGKFPAVELVEGCQ